MNASLQTRVIGVVGTRTHQKKGLPFQVSIKQQCFLRLLVLALPSGCTSRKRAAKSYWANIHHYNMISDFDQVIFVKALTRCQHFFRQVDTHHPLKIVKRKWCMTYILSSSSIDWAAAATSAGSTRGSELCRSKVVTSRVESLSQRTSRVNSMEQYWHAVSPSHTSQSLP
jgi:hypothetical protein